MLAGVGGKVEVEGRIWEVIKFRVRLQMVLHSQAEGVSGFCRTATFTSWPLLLHARKLNELVI